MDDLESRPEIRARIRSGIGAAHDNLDYATYLMAQVLERLQTVITWF